MTDIEPNRQDWEALYAAARQFREIQCWQWMHDVNVIGIKDPNSDLIGYGCVMGRLGQLFGLVVYLGPEGIALIRNLQFGRLSATDDQVRYGQHSLMVTFGERGCLQKRDRDVIKTMGLKPRGSVDWPLFRSYRPGYVPWFVTQEEARFLTVVLQRVRTVALRAKKNPGIFGPGMDGGCLVQSPEAGPDGIVWTEKLSDATETEDQITLLPPLDRGRVNEIRAKNLPRSGIWEVETSFFPTGTADRGERPYYPRMLMCVDQQNEYVLTTRLARPHNYVEEFRDELCRGMLQLGLLPATVMVPNIVTFHLLQPLTTELGIELRLEQNLRALHRARRELMRFGGRG